VASVRPEGADLGSVIPEAVRRTVSDAGATSAYPWTDDVRGASVAELELFGG